jgi:hypothetical protein
MVGSDDVENASNAAAEWADRFDRKYNEEKGGPGAPWFKIGLAMLGPTIALFGIMSGVLLNARSESAARDSEASARMREELIRQNELAVPIYQEVATAQAEVDYWFRRCEEDLNDWAATAPDSPEEEVAEQAIERICEDGVDRAIATLEANIEQALLVSNDVLLTPVGDYREALATWNRELASYRDVDADPCASQLEVDDASVVEFADDDDFESYVLCREEELEWFEASINDLNKAREKLQEAVREQVFSPGLTDS